MSARVNSVKKSRAYCTFVCLDGRFNFNLPPVHPDNAGVVAAVLLQAALINFTEATRFMEIGPLRSKACFQEESLNARQLKDPVGPR
jgi:hypothetical protein